MLPWALIWLSALTRLASTVPAVGPPCMPLGPLSVREGPPGTTVTNAGTRIISASRTASASALARSSPRRSTSPTPTATVPPTTPSSAVTLPASPVNTRKESVAPPTSVAGTYRRRSPRYAVRKSGPGATPSTHSWTLFTWRSDRPVASESASVTRGTSGGWFGRLSTYTVSPTTSNPTETAVATRTRNDRERSVAAPRTAPASTTRTTGDPVTSTKWYSTEKNAAVSRARPASATALGWSTPPTPTRSVARARRVRVSVLTPTPPRPRTGRRGRRSAPRTRGRGTRR
jgi:hypothetical protein